MTREKRIGAVVRAARDLRDSTRNVGKGSGWPEARDEDVIEAWKRLDTALGRLDDAVLEQLQTHGGRGRQRAQPQFGCQRVEGSKAVTRAQIETLKLLIDGPLPTSRASDVGCISGICASALARRGYVKIVRVTSDRWGAAITDTGRAAVESMHR